MVIKFSPLDETISELVSTLSDPDAKKICVVLELGRRGRLDEDALTAAVNAWNAVRNASSVTHIVLLIDGYGRDVCDVPEVQAYVQEWAKRIGLTTKDHFWDVWHMPVLGREGYD